MNKKYKENKKTRYILFGSNEIYYALGGANDFITSSNNLSELEEYAGIISKTNHDGGIAWWHIFDTNKNKIILGTRVQAHGNEDLIIN